MASCNRGLTTGLAYSPQFYAHQFKLLLRWICSFMESSQFGLVQLMPSARHTYANQSTPIQGVVADAPSSNYSSVHGQVVGDGCAAVRLARASRLRRRGEPARADHERDDQRPDYGPSKRILCYRLALSPSRLRLAASPST